MPNVNQVTIGGHVTRTPELRQAGATQVCEFGVAVNERRKSGQDWIEEVSFIEVCCFGKSAEIAAESLDKGSGVIVTGKLKQDRWEKDGQKFSKVKIIGFAFPVAGREEPGESQERRPERDEHSQVPPKERASNPPTDEIPF